MVTTLKKEFQTAGILGIEATFTFLPHVVDFNSPVPNDNLFVCVANTCQICNV